MAQRMQIGSLRPLTHAGRPASDTMARGCGWGGPGDVEADVKMKWGSLQISGASRSAKAPAHANCFNCAALLRSGPLNRSGKKTRPGSLAAAAPQIERSLPHGPYLIVTPRFPPLLHA